jgi:hypothetical protein
MAYLGSRAEWNLIILGIHKFVSNSFRTQQRPYKCGSSTSWNNKRDSVDPIAKKKRGGVENEYKENLVKRKTHEVKI